MKRSKKLLMVLGISGALAATALTITTTTLLSKNVANDNVTPANQNTDFSILNKHKYSEKLNEVETLLHNDLKHNKYQDIRSELDNSKDEISKTITNESNEVDYTNAINSLQEAIDKALNKKAKADKEETRVNAKKEKYDKKLLELSEYENTYLSRVEIKRIKALRDNLIAEKEAINNAIYNQELKTQSLYDNAIEKLDDLLYNTKEKRRSYC